MKLVLAAAAAVTALAAAPAVAQPMGATSGASAEAAKTAEGLGQIKSVDAKTGSVTLHHGPIASLGWPAMTMTFKATPEALKTAKVGQTVKFTLQTPGNLILAIQPQ
jgi:Cu(I)/Ag(I) efflux system protein CusF